MKKLILLIVLLSVMSVSYAQKRLNITFLTSPQVSWLKSDASNLRGDGGFLGFGYGVEGDFFLASENYAIISGMTVSTSGGSLVCDQSLLFGGENLAAGTKIDYYLTNLEIPLALKMRTRDFNRFRYFAQFGLTNWINIKARATTSDGKFHKQPVMSEIRSFSTGLNVGGGIEYDVGHGNAITVGLVYSNGFTDITANKSIKDVTNLKVLRFRLGFVF